MKSGFKIRWSDFALAELERTIEYLQANWTEKELTELFSKLEETLNLISQNPNLFQASAEKKEVRRVVILRYNTLYYRFFKNNVEIISFFSNRESPKKRKLK